LGNPGRHLRALEKHLVRVSPTFDAGWYLLHYPDVAEAKYDPAAHFHLYGCHGGRRANTRVGD
jgi:hypothetical protein